jgi:hypothetical protein
MGFMKNSGAYLIQEMLTTVSSESLVLLSALYLDSAVTLYCYIIRNFWQNWPCAVKLLFPLLTLESPTDWRIRRNPWHPRASLSHAATSSPQSHPWTLSPHTLLWHNKVSNLSSLLFLVTSSGTDIGWNSTREGSYIALQLYRLFCNYGFIFAIIKLCYIDVRCCDKSPDGINTADVCS